LGLTILACLPKLISPKKSIYLADLSYPELELKPEFSSELINPESFLSGDGICQIHNSEMSAERIEIKFGLPSIQSRTQPRIQLDTMLAYREIRAELFPNCDDPFIYHGCVFIGEPYALIYVCPNCNNERDQYLQSHSIELAGW
jgi:hypothetical protein